MFNIESDTLRVLALREKLAGKLYWAIGGFNTPPLDAPPTINDLPPDDVLLKAATALVPAVRQDTVGTLGVRQGATASLDEHWYLYDNVVDTDYPYHSRVDPLLPASLAATHLCVTLDLALGEVQPFSYLALYSHTILRPLATGVLHTGSEVNDWGLLHWIGSYPLTTPTTDLTYYLYL